MTRIATEPSRSVRRGFALAIALALGLYVQAANAQRPGGGDRPGRPAEAAPGWNRGSAAGRDGYYRFGGFPPVDRGYDARRYAAPAYGYPDGPRSSANRRVWGRGQVLPFDYRAAEVPDPGRYHLRRPPAGFGWVGDGRNAYLMQRSTGMVLDSVPHAYEPAPAARRPRR